MGSLGTFKPFCKRGHPRIDNVDSTGHCLTCQKMQKEISAEKKKGPTAKGVFKEFCTRGHKRAGNVTARGHCLTCMKEWRKTEHEYGWQRVGIKNEDGGNFDRHDYNRAFQIQGGMCKICGSHQSELKGRLRVDHDHKTGKFRGLLCNSCNMCLGMVRDSPDKLRVMADYLEAPR